MEAELHVIGEILSAESFPGSSLFCTYEFTHGMDNWKHVQGRNSGTTHLTENNGNIVPWATPLDVHYAFSSVHGWPRMAVQVWSVDQFDRKDVVGYGTCFVPMPTSVRQRKNNNEKTLFHNCDDTSLPPHAHEVVIHTWKPTYWHSSTMIRKYRQFRQMIMGGNPVLKDDTVIHGTDNRDKLQTVSGGIVKLRFTVLSRYAASAGLNV